MQTDTIKSDEKFSWKIIFNAAVLAAALGYFVDIYDLLLFSIVRVPSLKDIGIAGNDLMSSGAFLLSVQMTGMLLGGIIWGILGDKKGRLQILFGSIAIYSIANFANGFVHNLELYAILRFVAGFGLAGELGAGITLVAEVIPTKYRGYSTMIVPSIGVLGAVLAFVVAENFNWRIAYFIGGVLGLLLLTFQVKVFESGIFDKIKSQTSVKRGNFFSLFSNKKRFLRYLKCTFLGMPLWYIVGLLITFSPEIAKALNIQDKIIAGKAVMFTYLGFAIGDFLSGTISQIIKSRKKVLSIFIPCTLISVIAYVSPLNTNAFTFYTICLLLGISGGYWAVILTLSAEQFGTNIRATVTTTVPNFVRGTVPLISYMFITLKQGLGIVNSAAIVGIFTVAIALLSLWGLEETFGKDLNYIEE